MATPEHSSVIHTLFYLTRVGVFKAKNKLSRDLHLSHLHPPRSPDLDTVDNERGIFFVCVLYPFRPHLAKTFECGTKIRCRRVVGPRERMTINQGAASCGGR